jgi:hypothetical protein
MTTKNQWIETFLIEISNDEVMKAVVRNARMVSEKIKTSELNICFGNGNYASYRYDNDEWKLCLQPESWTENMKKKWEKETGEDWKKFYKL